MFTGTARIQISGTNPRFPCKNYRPTRRLLSADNNRTGRNIRKRTVDLYIVKSVFIADYSESRLRRCPNEEVRGSTTRGMAADPWISRVRRHVIYFRRYGGSRPISRKWHFRGPTFPESNNTESSFNKGSATIYRGHASHSHLSASTAYIATPLSRVPHRPFFRNCQQPLSFQTIVCRYTSPVTFSFSLSPILFSPPCLTRSFSLSFCPYTPLVDTRIFFIVPLFRARTRLGSDCGRVCVKGTIRLSGPVSLF